MLMTPSMGNPTTRGNRIIDLATKRISELALEYPLSSITAFTCAGRSGSAAASITAAAPMELPCKMIRA